MTNDPYAIAKLSAAVQALAEAKTIGEIKPIIDLAATAKFWAKRNSLSLEAQNAAAEIHLDGQRKAGEVLKQLQRDHPGRQKDSGNGAAIFCAEYREVLQETETPEREARRWQQIAEIPEPVYVERKAEIKGKRQELNTKVMLKTAKDVKRKEELERRQVEAEQAVDAWPDWLIIGDMRTAGAAIADNSVDMIFTDPPYHEEAAKLYGDLAAFGARVLKPGGICIAYSGQLHLPHIYVGMGQHLTYMWTCAIGHSAGATMFRKWRINNLYKPLLMYGKPPLNAWWDTFFDDYVTGGREKDAHPWQQAVGEATHYISAVCPKHGLVCDPFLGSGTSLVAAKLLGMRYIGLEINPATAQEARQRIEKENE